MANTTLFHFYATHSDRWQDGYALRVSTPAGNSTTYRSVGFAPPAVLDSPVHYVFIDDDRQLVITAIKREVTL